MTNDIVVRVTDLRSMPSLNSRRGMCAGGARLIAEQTGLDWSKFVTEGLPSSVLEATGNQFCLDLVKHARERAAGEQQ